MFTKAIFPQAILGINKLNVDSNKILKYIENIEFTWTGTSIIKQSSCMISKNKKIFEEINFLKDEISQNIKHYLNDVLKLDMNFQFTSSWATKTPSEGFSQLHSHSNSFLSGVYYPKGDENFIINFYKKKIFWNINVNESNDFNSQVFKVSILEDNFLILFPSDLDHSIEVNQSKNIRYSIAFNVIPFGKIGSGDSEVNFK